MRAREEGLGSLVCFRIETVVGEGVFEARFNGYAVDLHGKDTKWKQVSYAEAPSIHIRVLVMCIDSPSHPLWLDPACRASQPQDSSAIERLRSGVASNTSVDVGATGFWAEGVNRTKREAMLRLSCEVSHNSHSDCFETKVAVRLLEP